MTGQWDQPGMGGKASEVFAAVTGETDGDPAGGLECVSKPVRYDHG